MPPAALPMAPAIRFHLSLNVADLSRSVAFYRTLFGTEPAKLRSDYAKFELDDPPLVLSLEPSAKGTGGALNHLGFRLPDVPSLVATQERLERAGVRSQREAGVECCYAKQTKFWVHDPDGTLWEMYVLEGDIDHRGSGQLPEKVLGTNGHSAPSAPAPAAAPERFVWQHLMGQPVPEKLPLADASADEVMLRGSFNLPLKDADRQHLVSEALRVLKPGGRLFVHVLVAERPLSASPQLPGPASAVQHTPLESEPVRLLEEAGFTGVRMEKFDAKPCFVREGIGLRELQLAGFKPGGSAPAVTVLYKGPLREVTDDAGRVYRRGERVTTDAATAERLTRGPLADQFAIFG